jgi:hypothetical protein
VCHAPRECEQYARHMTKPDPKDGSTLNFNSPEEQKAVEVVFQNAITPLAEVGIITALPHGTISCHLCLSKASQADFRRLQHNSYRLCSQLTGCFIFRCAVGDREAPAVKSMHPLLERGIGVPF